MTQTTRQLIQRAVNDGAQRKALTFLRQGRVETVLTYAQLGREVAAFATRLKCEGICPGDRVILFMQKSVDMVVAHLALQTMGAVCIPLNPGFKESEMRYLLGDAQARMVLCDADKGAWLGRIDGGIKILQQATHQPYRLARAGAFSLESDAAPEITPQDPGLIVYTSGTTGNPKGAVLTQSNLTHDAAKIITAWQIAASDVLCHALPLFHIHGLCFALHTALFSGAHVVMPDTFTPGAVLDLLTRRDGADACTIFMAVPAMYTKLLDWFAAHAQMATPDFSHLRLLTSGSAPLLPREFERIQAFFGQGPVEREGMSETGMNFSNPLRGNRVPGSIGIPLPEVRVRIVDPRSFRDVAPGSVGEIWLQGPGITPGYWNKPEETRKTFEGPWFRTGDLGRKDGQGYYYLTDRMKHIIISGGENVSAKEVETVIQQMDDVVESSVVGVPDPEWGERVSAAVVLRPHAGLSAEQIRAHCKIHLHDWKCPKKIKFIRELPRNTMGKVLKEQVKKLFN